MQYPHGLVSTSSVSNAAPLPRWRQQAIFLIKLVHTLIFAVVSTSVLQVFWTGLRNRPSRWTTWATGIVLTEAAIFAANRWQCPLTGWTEHLGAEHGQVTDIFLPRWFATRIPLFYTPLFLIGIGSHLWHYWHR